MVLRKLLEIKEDEIVNPVWKNADAAVKDTVKKNSLAALAAATDKNSLKTKTVQAIAEIPCIAFF